ncbi:MAG: response regulator [Spirochaetes bacterium]|nr:response regulator [Spirochaetota bacterium]
MENEKVLIIMVDDNPANLKIGKNVLSEKYRVATAPSAKKLFSLLENNYPAMILLDINMPDMDGYETIKILKSKPDSKNIPVIFVTGRTESDAELEGLSLGAIDYITKPFQPALLLKRIENHLQMVTQQKTLKIKTAELQYLNSNLENIVKEKTINISNLKDALLKTMSKLVDFRDGITGTHIDRTQYGIKIMLEEIKNSNLYPEETDEWDLELLLQSCQLHDIGKIKIGDNILKKQGKLSHEEFEEMKKHATYGEEIIEEIELLTKGSELLKYAKIFAASHHEKWDGTGYPRRLKGNDIPLLGRIMAIADVYDALTSARSYKQAFIHEEAVQIIAGASGTQFDPAMVKLFIIVSEQFRNLTASGNQQHPTKDVSRKEL